MGKKIVRRLMATGMISGVVLVAKPALAAGTPSHRQSKINRVQIIRLEAKILDVSTVELQQKLQGKTLTSIINDHGLTISQFHQQFEQLLTSIAANVPYGGLAISKQHRLGIFHLWPPIA